MTRTITALTGALLISGAALAAPPAEAEFEAARTYTQGKLTVAVSKPTLFSTAAEDGGRHYALGLAMRIDNRLGRTVGLDLNSTTVLDRMDHPLASPDAFRDGKPVDGDPQVKNREKAVLHLFFNVKNPVLLDRFDFHWTVVDRGKAMGEITPYRAASLPLPTAAPAASAAPGPATREAGAAGGGLPGGPPRGPGKRTSQAAAMLASYHFYRDLLHADILGSSLQPPSGLPWTTVQVAPRELPMDGGSLGF